MPVVANGDVCTLADYLVVRAESGCDDVMLGRGAVIRPDLARQIGQHLRGETVHPAVFNEEIMDWIRLFFDLCQTREPQGKYAVARLKQWLGMLKKAYPAAQQLFDAVRTLRDAQDVWVVVQGFQAARKFWILVLKSSLKNGFQAAFCVFRLLLKFAANFKMKFLVVLLLQAA